MKKFVLPFLIILITLSLTCIFCACAKKQPLPTDKDAQSSGNVEEQPKPTPEPLPDDENDNKEDPENQTEQKNDGYDYTLYVNDSKYVSFSEDGTFYVYPDAKKDDVITSNKSSEFKIETTLDTNTTVTLKDKDDKTIGTPFSATAQGKHTISFINGTFSVTPPEDPTYLLTVNGKNERVLLDESIKLSLNEGDEVKVKNSKDTLIYSSKLNKGNYVFSISHDDISVIKTKGEETDYIPLYYSNSLSWQGDIYAYCWNSKTQVQNAAWPGEKCTYLSNNEYGQGQYSYRANAKDFDRIIFNNNNQQTMDIALNSAVSGFYDTSAPFVFWEADYGKVDYYTLSDEKNLYYRTDKRKEISVYTPSGYDNNKKYGVLVVFDAQNVFAAATGAKITSSYHGAWAMDVAMTALKKNRKIDGVIIVGIDNGDSYRNSELTMSQDFGTLDPRLTEGEADVQGFYNGHLDDLGNFILDTVLPFVKENYSVDGDPLSTGICGSSSGGLGAYYLGLRDLGVYGYIGAFSPAIGLFIQDAWKDFYNSKEFSKNKVLPEIYLYCGSGDGYLEDILLESTAKTKNLLTSAGYPSEFIDETYTKNSEHTETWWRLYFTEFLSKYVGK